MLGKGCVLSWKRARCTSGTFGGCGEIGCGGIQVCAPLILQLGLGQSSLFLTFIFGRYVLDDSEGRDDRVDEKDS